MLVTMVPDSPDVERSPEGIRGAVQDRSSPICPQSAVTRRLADRASAAGASCWTRRCPAARRARLPARRSWWAAMPAIRSARAPIFQAMGKRVTHIGPSGQAARQVVQSDSGRDQSPGGQRGPRLRRQGRARSRQGPRRVVEPGREQLGVREFRPQDDQSRLEARVQSGCSRRTCASSAKPREIALR